MIRFEHLSKTFQTKDGAFEALKDVSFEIEKGDIYGVIGYSGAGKSTLIRMVNALERPTSGKIFVEDKDIGSLSAKELRSLRKGIGMIFQQFNHPSVVFWGIFSDQDPRGDDPTDYIKGLNAMAMQEDPSRMTTATSNQDGPINFVTDLIVWDLPFGWKEGMPGDLKIWLEQLQKKWGSLCSGITYGAGASIYHQEDSLYRPNYLGNWHPERWQTSLHEQYFPLVDASPFLWGWFVANMFDYGAAGRDWGEGTGIDDRGLVTFDRKYRKDAFYFYKANWNKAEPMVYIAQKRWTPRVKTTQTIRVYSNAPEVELLVNGASLGRKTGANGVFLWENVELRRGVNALEARSDTSIDYADIRVL